MEHDLDSWRESMGDILAETEEPVEQSVLDQLEAKTKEFVSLDAEGEMLELALKRISEEKAKLKADVINLLQLANKRTWQVGDKNVTLATRTSVSFPKTPDEKEAFFRYLQEKGQFDELISIHSQTLNSWFKAEAKAAGLEDDMLFEHKVPGLQPKTSETLQVRTAKKKS